MKQIFAPLIGIYTGIASMLDEKPGSKSIKRGISGVFAIAVLYMVWYFLNKRVPIEDQPTFRYLFLGLCIMIALLTGAAMMKDIIALKNGTKESPDTTNNPEKTPQEQTTS